MYAKAYMLPKERSPLAKRVKGYQDWQNKPYQLDIVGGVAYIDPTKPNTRKKLLWWSPHINGGFNLGGDIQGLFMRPAINFSTSGYGRSRNDLDYKFLHLGFDIDTEFDKPGLTFMPFSWRPWEAVLTNTYIGPGVGWTRDGINYHLGMNLSF